MAKEKISRRKVLIAIVAVIIIAVSTAMAFFILAPPARIEAGVLKVGFTTSLSGGFAIEGKRQLEGILLWQEWVNKAGGIYIPALRTRYTIELVYYDDESKKENVIRLYEKLITEDKVDFLISPYSSTLALTASEVVEKHKRTMVVTGAASDVIFLKGSKYIVQVYTPGTRYLHSTIDLLNTIDPKAKIALIYKDDAFSRSAAEGAKAYIEKLGLNLVLYEKYPDKPTDLSPLITRLKAAAPDVVIGGGHIADGMLFTRQAAGLGLKVKMLSLLVAPAEERFYTELKELAEGVMGPSQWEPDVKYKVNYGPTVEEFVRMHKEKYGYMPTYHTAGGFAAGLFLQAALERVKSLAQEEVRAAFNELDLVTFWGGLKIDPETGLQKAHAMVLVQWQKGVKVIVAPSDAKTGEPVYPMKP